jgi:hypothetical protein
VIWRVVIWRCCRLGVTSLTVSRLDEMLQRAGDTRAAWSVHAQQDPTPFIGEKSKQPTSLSLNEAAVHLLARLRDLMLAASKMVAAFSG